METLKSPFLLYSNNQTLNVVKMIIVEYGIPIEVSKTKYEELRKMFSGILAFREEAGKYFIKLFATKYQDQVQKAINQ